jgi:hypothetical protein
VGLLWTSTIEHFRTSLCDDVDAFEGRSGQSFEEWRVFPEFIETDEQMKNQLHSLSGGLAEHTKFGLQLIHQSVQDCLLSRGFAMLDDSTDANNDLIRVK